MDDAQPLPNFAAASSGWAKYATSCSAQKRPMPPPIFHTLERYVSDPGASVDGTTFRHLAEYLATGNEAAQPHRLEVACVDFGYTLEELRALRAEGKTGRHVAAEVVGRGVRSSSSV